MSLLIRSRRSRPCSRVISSGRLFTLLSRSSKKLRALKCFKWSVSNTSIWLFPQWSSLIYIYIYKQPCVSLLNHNVFYHFSGCGLPWVFYSRAVGEGSVTCCVLSKAARGTPSEPGQEECSPVDSGNSPAFSGLWGLTEDGWDHRLINKHNSHLTCYCQNVLFMMAGGRLLSLLQDKFNFTRFFRFARLSGTSIRWLLERSFKREE